MFVWQNEMKILTSYVEALNKLVLWFFSLDQTNCAIWLPVCIRDLKILSHVHPETENNFQNGNFVIHKIGSMSSDFWRWSKAQEVLFASQRTQCIQMLDGGRAGIVKDTDRI